jgi:hypothetical protein
VFECLGRGGRGLRRGRSLYIISTRIKMRENGKALPVAKDNNPRGDGLGNVRCTTGRPGRERSLTWPPAAYTRFRWANDGPGGQPFSTWSAWSAHWVFSDIMRMGRKDGAWLDQRRAQYATRYIPSLIFLTAGSHQNSPNREETPLPHGSLH